MRPGRRDTLIGLFEREFVESQETCGMVPIGHYRDLDDPDSFPWFRGFTDMHRRRAALEAFYERSRAWHDHREAANATMVDSDNVLLLRGARPDSGFDTSGLTRPAGNEPGDDGALVSVSIAMLNEPADERFVRAFEDLILPTIRTHADRVAYLVTEDCPNDFPKLPVRDGEHAFVVAGICRTEDALHSWQAAIDPQRLPPVLRERTKSSENLRLMPAARCLFR
jgi:hypothetical protein